MFLFKKARLFFWIKYINILKKFKIHKGFPVHYIGGSEALPPPLSSDEESYLLRKLEKEDYGVKKILIERNLRLVVYIARKFENTGVGVEDLVSIGTIGLIKAINTFNPSKNIKLATYASRCIENEILMYLRKTTKIKSEVSIDEPLNKDTDGNELLLSDVLGTSEDITSENIENEVYKNLLKDSISKLNSREKNIMELRFGFSNNGKEKTQKEVAEMLRNFAKLHIKTGKENYRENEKRDNKFNKLKTNNKEHR
jgi:RNA polymerase sporulation-specific sigma factor